MCCKRCLQYSSCHSLTDFHVHPAAHSFLPAPHFHLCGPTRRDCDLNCKVCGKLIREMPHFPSSHFVFGCCHRCAEYLRCDFVERHRESLQGEAESAELVTELAAVSAMPDTEHRRPSVPGIAPDSLRILLLDDNAEFRTSAVEYLALDPALKVFGAADGYTALHIAHEFRPTVVVCDLMMEGMNGFDFCRNLRKSDCRADVHVLALTGFASKDMVEKALSCGAERCLSKPIRLQELKAVIMEAARAGAATPAPDGIAPQTEASGRLPVRVLVVDDDAAFVEATVEFLQGSPVFMVRGAKDGSSGLRQYFSFKPHVVVLDLLMAKVTGLDICNAIRNSKLSAETRILVVTGDLSLAADQKARKCGANACLKKPVTLDQLRQETWRLGQEVVEQQESPQEPK
jgi:CheY-like chemotaxis protein